MLNELGDLGDFIGGIAVVLSLIYLAIQIRQNTATVRVQTVQHLLTSDTSAADSLIQGPMPEIQGKLRSGSELSPREIAAYTLYMRGRLTEAWQVVYQRQNRMIEAEVADALLERLEGDVGYGLFRAVWKQIKTGFPPDFQDYVEARMLSARPRVQTQIDQKRGSAAQQGASADEPQRVPIDPC